MAEQLKTYKFTGGNSIIYPWDKWFNGKPWRLERVKDFHVSISSFRSQAAFAAARIGMKIRTKAESETILVIQAFKPEK